MYDHGFTSNTEAFCFVNLLNFVFCIHSKYRQIEYRTVTNCILKCNSKFHCSTSATVFSFNFKIILTAKPICFFR